MLRQITVDRVNDPVDIYASDDSRIYASILGTEGIHNIGSCMRCEAIGTNQFRIGDGVASVQGHIAIIDPGEEEILTGDPGVSGYNRIDLIVLDFTTNGQDDELTLKVIKGRQAINPTEPSYVQQDLTQGGTHRQVPLWKIQYEGTLVKTISRFGEVIPSLNDLVKTSETTVDIEDGTNLTMLMKTAKNFVCYRKPAGVSISNGIPDSDSTYCFYIKLRTSVICYRYSDKTTWFSNFLNDKLDEFKTFISTDQMSDSVEVSEKGIKVADAYALKILNDKLKSFVEKKYSGAAELSNLTNLEQWARTVDNYAFYRKDANIKVQGGIPNSDATVCFYVRIGTFVFGHRVSDKTLWYAPFYNDKLSDFAELTNVESVKYKENLIKDIPSGSYLGNFLPAADNFRIYRKDKSTSITGGLPNSDGSYEFFIKFGSVVLGYSTNGHYYMGACLNSTMEGWIELPDSDGTLSNLSLNRSGTGQLSLLTFKRSGSPVMAFISEEDGSLRLASYNNNQYVSSPLIAHRNGDVDVVGTLKTGTSSWGAGFAHLLGSSPHIDFHYGSSADFAARLIQTASNILRFDIVNSSGTTGYVELYKSNNSSNPITSWRPMTDNAAYLGDSAHKWNTVYATNTQIQSDKKTKRQIADIDKAEEFIMGLEPKQYKLKNSDTKEGRLHYGFIAQDVAKLAEAIEVGDLSMYQAAVIEVDENGSTVELNYDPDTKKMKDSSLSWSLNYNEIIAPLVAVVQKQQEQIKELQELLKEEKQYGTNNKEQ